MTIVTILKTYKSTTLFIGMAYSNNTLFIGKVLHHFDLLDSTNSEAQKLILQGKAIEGTIISTDYQTGGKGQRGNTWESIEGLNLLMSVILKPSFLLAKNQFEINQFVSLALVDLISNILPQKKIKIKWPNDIYIGDKKVAGILIQNILKASQIQYCIIGIGLNINQLEFSKGLINPTSLSLESGKQRKFYEVNDIKMELAADLEKRYLQLKNKSESLSIEYLDSLYAKDSERTFEDLNKKEVFKGLIRNVDDSGKLVIEVLEGADEKFLSFNFKEVRIIT